MRHSGEGSVTIKREVWGWSIWDKARQVGASVGMDWFAFNGIVLTVQQRRILRKHGLVVLQRES